METHKAWPITDETPKKCIILLLYTNLSSKRLRIDTDLLLMITSTADELSRNTNINVFK